MTTTSPSESRAESKALDLLTWRHHAANLIMNSAVVSDFVFEETWKLARQAAKDSPNAPPIVGKDDAKRAITDRLLHYLTSVDGQVERLIKGRDA